MESVARPLDLQPQRLQRHMATALSGCIVITGWFVLLRDLQIDSITLLALRSQCQADTSGALLGPAARAMWVIYALHWWLMGVAMMLPAACYTWVTPSGAAPPLTPTNSKPSSFALAVGVQESLRVTAYLLVYAAAACIVATLQVWADRTGLVWLPFTIASVVAIALWRYFQRPFWCESIRRNSCCTEKIQRRDAGSSRHARALQQGMARGVRCATACAPLMLMLHATGLMNPLTMAISALGLLVWRWCRTPRITATKASAYRPFIFR